MTENGEDFNITNAQVKPVTVAELQTQLKNMAKGRAADHNGAVVELLQSAGEGMLSLTAAVHSDMMDAKALVTSQWKETRLKSIFPKRRPGNAR